MQLCRITVSKFWNDMITEATSQGESSEGPCSPLQPANIYISRFSPALKDSWFSFLDNNILQLREQLDFYKINVDNHKVTFCTYYLHVCGACTMQLFESLITCYNQSCCTHQISIINRYGSRVLHLAVQNSKFVLFPMWFKLIFVTLWHRAIFYGP